MVVIAEGLGDTLIKGEGADAGGNAKLADIGPWFKSQVVSLAVSSAMDRDRGCMTAALNRNLSHFNFFGVVGLVAGSPLHNAKQQWGDSKVKLDSMNIVS